jgi:hypothetical protein
MKNLKKLVAATAVATALTATSASALTMTFDFGGANNAGAPSIAFTQGAYTVTASGSVTDNARNAIALGGVKVTQTKATANPNGGGLGILNTSKDDHDIDGFKLYNDLLSLTFNKTVKIKSVRFSRVDSNDMFDFWLGGAYQFSAATPFPLAQYALGFIGKTFGFGATEDTSEYKIRSITVSSVPLPPAMVLMFTGLLGIGALGRRRNKNSAAV